jgi:hypothetical protein
MGVGGGELQRKGAVGGEHERVTVGSAVGAGLQRGAAGAGDGKGDADAAECARRECAHDVDWWDDANRSP